MSKADEPFLSRWSRRKSEARETAPAVEQPASEEKGNDTALLSEEPRAEGPQRALMPEGRGKDVLKRVLTEADFADVNFGALDFKSDYSRFMQPGVPDEIRNKALRQLWVSDPIMANMDGLHDYWDDYTDDAVAVPTGTLKTVYRVGRGFLSDEEIAKWEALGRPEKVEERPLADHRELDAPTEKVDTATPETAQQVAHRQPSLDVSSEPDAAASAPSEHSTEAAGALLSDRLENS